VANQIPSPAPAEWDERLRGLAALLPLFNGPGSDADAAINALNEAAYRLGWVLTDFDWSKWAHGPECQTLVTNPANVASAGPLTLARLLTAHLRQDRFCEGHLLGAFEDGHLTAIVRRAADLLGGRTEPSGSARSGSRPTPLFTHHIGIDYSGAQTPDSSLPGLRVYMAERHGVPVEVRPAHGPKKHWTRRGIAEWLVARLAESEPTIVGIDHGFSFPIKYFERHGLSRDWPAFLDDFHRHWPTDAENTYVEFVREGTVGNGSARAGDAKWRRIAEVRAGGAKSVFHFDVQGSVAKSTHAGLPWLRYIRQRLPGRVHFWPFDGWIAPAGRSVIAEVYPSLWSRSFPKTNRSPDQHDAWSVAEWLRRADLQGGIAAYLNPDLSAEDRATALVEGWILGLG
jgi:hypothetical protein